MADSTDLASAKEPSSAGLHFDHRETSGTRKIFGVLILMAVLASLTSVLYFAHFHDLYTDDSPGYIRPAANLLAGNGFTDAQGHPDTLRTPDIRWSSSLFSGPISISSTSSFFSICCAY